MPALILLVEDHLDTRQMYAEFMAMHYEVVEAATGTEAIQHMTARRPDVLVYEHNSGGTARKRRLRRNGCLCTSAGWRGQRAVHRNQRQVPSIRQG